MMRHNNPMQKLKSLINTFIFSGLLSISFYGLAIDSSSTKPQTETWYQIEILVYEPVEQALAGESWPAIVNNEIPEDTVELAPINIESTAEPVAAFQQLAPETLNLAETANKLIASRRYRIITLQGWQQPVKQRNEAEAIHLTDKKAEIVDAERSPIRAENGEVILNPPSQPVIETLDIQAINEEPVIEEIPARIDGTVKVSLSRYLHMALKLNYYNPDVYLAEQIALQKPDEVLIDTFVMNQSRRMRSKEIHVFDHPYFGVITTITPIERVTKK